MNRITRFWFDPLLAGLFIAVLLLGGCGGSDGANGIDGADGADGTDGAPGLPGAAGTNVKVSEHHGTEMLLSTGEFVQPDPGKVFVTVTNITATADANGVARVNFSVEDDASDPVVGVTGVDFSIAKLVPPDPLLESANKWVSYYYRTETVSGTTYPMPDGFQAEQAYRESNGTFTDNGDGSYSYVFATNLANVVKPVSNTPVSYDRSLTHRIAIMMGGHSGPTADAYIDFVPDGSPVTETRDVIDTISCQGCHGEFQFAGHGGDRLQVQVCVTCHNPDNLDAQSGETLDMKVMIHKIHAGHELASIEEAVETSGYADNVWQLDDADRADFYAIYGYRNSKHTWWKVGYPAVIENCTKCHQGSGGDVDNWKNVPSGEACGSCHDTVSFTTDPTTHYAGVQDDAACNTCHQPSGANSFALSVAGAHNWTSDDVAERTKVSDGEVLIDWRNIPEFDIDLTVSAPQNGNYFEADEQPVVSIVINKDGVPINHLTVDDDPTTDGCPAPDPVLGCQTDDGLFTQIYLFVHGPRAERNPVLTTAARADVVSSIAGPFNLSAFEYVGSPPPTGFPKSLDLLVDSGQDVITAANGGASIPGNISVDLTTAAFATFSNTSAVTPAEVVAWLNADADFAARAIAYLENGFVAIRSRNLGKFFAVQLEAGVVNTALFNDDTGIYVVGGYYPSNDLVLHAASTDDDPKATWSADSIDYLLDPVDDLQPGTYVASVEIADAGRVNGSNYKTPSVAKTTFQVGQAAEELAPAGNCGTCHWGPQGTGFVLDFARHYKIFDNTAIDQCAACHDYQSGFATGDWFGGRPISKRVHAVHYGSSLNYPLLTVDYSGGDPIAGRNWDITFPRDILECETCHSGTSNDTWTKAARLPCSGCHDSDQTTAHLKAMTWDLTPDNPWNGDEEESCQVCHN